jgi:hypothetical protein
MSALFNWLHGARWRMSFSHCLEALIIQPLGGVIIWLAGYSVPVAACGGALIVAAYYYSREKSQFEQRVKIPGDSNTTVWAAGIWPGDWGQDSLLDFLFPVASSSGLAVALFFIDQYIHKGIT